MNYYIERFSKYTGWQRVTPPLANIDIARNLIKTLSEKHNDEPNNFSIVVELEE